MNNEKAIDVLNALIEINNDRIEGYGTAAKETKEEDLKTLFFQLIQTSQRCKTELVKEVQLLGGTPIEGTKTTGKIYRVWMDIKSAITGNNRKAILNSCEYGEDVAVQTYADALENNMDTLNDHQERMIEIQHALIKSDQNKVKSLLNMLAAQK